MTHIRAILAYFLLPIALSALPLHAQSEIFKLEATASYYGKEFDGLTTSSGERFDMNALTAAHKTLPFGTLLEVTNLANGKRVTVRVNDRGPFVENRELDVSYAAAEALGMLVSGTAKVSIRKLDAQGKQENPQAGGIEAKEGEPLWRIQLGSFSSEENAERFAATLRKAGFEPALERTPSAIRVVIPRVGDSLLESTKGKLVSSGFAEMLVRREMP